MLDIQKIQISFDDKPVLRDVDLSISQGEIVCLLGPSGCGKTTLLRVIAGLEIPQAGDVRLDGQSILKVPVHQRGFGLMFQDFALFPHLNVAGNIEFGLKMQGLLPAVRATRIQENLEIVGLTGFEKRDVTQLSGGERQRVALARSLAPNPHLLMLDEPLGSLDAALREQLAVELREIIKRVGLTAIYVTHDQNEAFAIADRIAVMNAGTIEQIDKPEDLYRRPVSTFVARFLQFENIFPVISQDSGRVHTAIGNFQVKGTPKAILLHPDGVILVDAHTPDTIQGIVEERVFMGDAYRITLRIKGNHTRGIPFGHRLVFKLPSVSPDVVNIGDHIAVQILPDMVIPLDAIPSA
jgi:ABC-type Fe3+/spermidine/putrescine transport system ATPase subunit